jgi:hypothetical protein
MPHVERALELAPGSGQIHTGAAASASLRGDHQAALRHAVSAVELGYPEAMPPLPMIRADLAAARGDHAEQARHILEDHAWLADSGGADAVRLICAAAAGPGPRRGAAISESTKLPPKISAMLLCAIASSLRPISFCQGLPNSGPYHSPPSRKADKAARNIAIQFKSISHPPDTTI